MRLDGWADTGDVSRSERAERSPGVPLTGPSIERTCPLCGAPVAIPADDPLFAALGPDDPPDDASPAHLDRVARGDRVAAALCCCYVFRMDESAIGRLMAGILASDE
jgi:hypothetical protein